VLAFVETGASWQEAAERFEGTVSSAIQCVQRFVRFGNAAAKPTGQAHSTTRAPERGDFAGSTLPPARDVLTPPK
jgi:hypothetical protein